ncbi:MAG: hypothetical protein HYY29_01255 [Chloroflexi bacterium]|nr:hypothetical protein [Chloroflexota bacterium]
MTIKERTITMNVVELRARLKRGNEDLKYFLERREDLTQKYSEEWVAIYHREVAAHAKTPAKLLKELRAKNVPQGQALIEFLTKTPKLTIPG